MGFSPFNSKAQIQNASAPTRPAPAIPTPAPTHTSSQHSGQTARSHGQRNRQQSHESFVSAVPRPVREVGGVGRERIDSRSDGSSGASPSFSSSSSSMIYTRPYPLASSSSSSTTSTNGTNQVTGTSSAQSLSGRRTISKQTSLTSMVDVWTAAQTQIQSQTQHDGQGRGLVGGDPRNAMTERQRSPSRVTFSEEVQVQYLDRASGSGPGSASTADGQNGDGAAGIGKNGATTSTSSSGGTGATSGFRSLFSRKKTVRASTTNSSIDSYTTPGELTSSPTGNVSEARSGSLTGNATKKIIARSRSSESLRRDRAGNHSAQHQQAQQHKQSGPGSPMYYPYKPSSGHEHHHQQQVVPKRTPSAASFNSGSSDGGMPSWRLPDESDAGLSIMGSDAVSAPARRSSGEERRGDGHVGQQGERRGSEERRRGSEDSNREGLRINGESVRSGKSSGPARSPSPSRSPLSQVAFPTAPHYPSSRGLSTPRSSHEQRPSSTVSSAGTINTSSIPTIKILTSEPFGAESPKRPYRTRTSSRPSPSASPTSPVFSHFASSAFAHLSMSQGDNVEGANRASEEGSNSVDRTRLSTANGAGAQEAWLGASLISTSPLSLEAAVFGHGEQEAGTSGPMSSGPDSLPLTPPTAHTHASDPSSSPFRPIFDRSNMISSIYADDEESIVNKPEPAVTPAGSSAQASRRSSRRMSGQSFRGMQNSANKRESIIVRSQQSKNAAKTESPRTAGLPTFDSGSSIMSLASLGIVFPTEDLYETAERDARARAEAREETAFVPMFNIIPATPVVIAGEFDSAAGDPKRQSWESGMGHVQIDATPRQLEPALELQEEVLAKAVSDTDAATPKMADQASVLEPSANIITDPRHPPSTALSSHKTTSSVSSATSTSAVSDSSSCSFATMTSMASLSTSSTASSFPDVEEALGAMLASLSAGGNGPHELMSFPDYMMVAAAESSNGHGYILEDGGKSSDGAGSWAGLGFEFGGQGDDLGTPKLGGHGGFNFGLGLGLEGGARPLKVTSPLVLPTERTPMVNHKVPFYSNVKACPSALPGRTTQSAAPRDITLDFGLLDDTPRQCGPAEALGLFETLQGQRVKQNDIGNHASHSHGRNDSVASVASSACESSLTTSSSMSSLSDMDDIENASISVVNNKGSFANSRTVQYSPRVQEDRTHAGSPRGEYGIGWAM